MPTPEQSQDLPALSTFSRNNRGLFGGTVCPLCGGDREQVQREIEERAMELLAARQKARLAYYRQRDRLVRELTKGGFIANVTLDGSVIITGRKP